MARFVPAADALPSPEDSVAARPSAYRAAELLDRASQESVLGLPRRGAATLLDFAEVATVPAPRGRLLASLTPRGDAFRRFLQGGTGDDLPAARLGHALEPAGPGNDRQEHTGDGDE